MNIQNNSDLQCIYGDVLVWYYLMISYFNKIVVKFTE